MNKYYIPFDLSKNVNYNYIFSLYSIAEFDTDTKRYNIIKYKSFKRLAEILNICDKTLKKILNDDNYKLFLTLDKQNKVIYLNNDFVNNNIPFVVLNENEVKILNKYNDNLLYKYFIYIKYFCGYAKQKNIQQNFTAKQFLEYCGYSTNSGDYISRIATFNGYLSNNGLIKINKIYDELGHKRNIYSI